MRSRGIETRGCGREEQAASSAIRPPPDLDGRGRRKTRREESGVALGDGCLNVEEVRKGLKRLRGVGKKSRGARGGRKKSGRLSVSSLPPCPPNPTQWRLFQQQRSSPVSKRTGPTPSTSRRKSRRGGSSSSSADGQSPGRTRASSCFLLFRGERGLIVFLSRRLQCTLCWSRSPSQLSSVGGSSWPRRAAHRRRAYGSPHELADPWLVCRCAQHDSQRGSQDHRAWPCLLGQSWRGRGC